MVAPDQLARAVRRAPGSLVLAGRLTDGADVVFDCVGSPESIAQALAMVRPRGRVVLVGMPGQGLGRPGPALAPRADPGGRLRLRHRARPASPEPHRTFGLAIELVASAGLGSLVSAAYPLERYQEAVAHAGAAGRRGAVKVVFDLRRPKGSIR